MTVRVFADVWLRLADAKRAHLPTAAAQHRRPDLWRLSDAVRFRQPQVNAKAREKEGRMNRLSSWAAFSLACRLQVLVIVARLPGVIAFSAAKRLKPRRFLLACVCVSGCVGGCVYACVCVPVGWCRKDGERKGEKITVSEGMGASQGQAQAVAQVPSRTAANATLTMFCERARIVAAMHSRVKTLKNACRRPRACTGAPSSSLSQRATCLPGLDRASSRYQSARSERVVFKHAAHQRCTCQRDHRSSARAPLPCYAHAHPPARLREHTDARAHARSHSCAHTRARPSAWNGQFGSRVRRALPARARMDRLHARIDRLHA
eukprot:4174243-Pleurochrysis_carterae.AAC.1